jgi:hypothetical protein
VHVIYIVSAVLGLFMQALVLHRLIFRKHSFYVLLFYMLALLAGTMVSLFAYVSNNKVLYRNAFWTEDLVLGALLFILVLSLINRTLSSNPHRLTIMGGLIALAGVVTVVSIITASGHLKLGLSVRSVGRNLSFSAAILSLILWLSIVRNRSRDFRLLLISGGLGIYSTGQAIAYSLSTFLGNALVLPNVVMIASHLLCLYVWWIAVGSNDSATPKARSVTSA